MLSSAVVIWAEPSQWEQHAHPHNSQYQVLEPSYVPQVSFCIARLHPYKWYCRCALAGLWGVGAGVESEPRQRRVCVFQCIAIEPHSPYRE